MCTCILHIFKNISGESIGYNTKLALTGLNGADRLFGWYFA